MLVYVFPFMVIGIVLVILIIVILLSFWKTNPTSMTTVFVHSSDPSIYKEG